VPYARSLRSALAVVAGFGAGAVPISNMVSRKVKGVDLRTVGNGTVSGTGLFRVAGAGPLVLAGVLELAKGAAGPLLAGRGRPLAAPLAAGAAVAGHNWSPFLGGAGGRGIAPALGGFLVLAPAGAATLMAGLVGGKIGGETALGCLVAYVLLVPVASHFHGKPGRDAAISVLVPLVVKRLAGNSTPDRRGVSVYLWRLLFDRDAPRKPLR
jgi:glycerol-3-phosphate acyltransferase PlsY